MSILNILYYPDERLRNIATTVKKIDSNIQHIVNDMFETMYEKKGIGLAATQVNINKRIIVIDISTSFSEKLTLINPVILEKSGSIKSQEGCLSIPEQHAFISRYKYIKIKAFNINGKEFELKNDSLLSICIQHEIDHLNGKLFIDYLSALKRQRILKKLNKLKRIKEKNRNC
ncbi:peptide deformylase [Arsenophonus symbiont of Ornithomya chloropus]|uniref:peptide deformylase n=1 Tax=Arsenophonus symbiont of Ornithomya chloropus TaxID=634121 RepID=UPI0032B2B481